MIRYLIGATALAVLLAAPAAAQTKDNPFALLKICKVGVGIPNGTIFNFNVTGNSSVVPVASGSPPGGSCWIAGQHPLNSTVIVTELPTSGTVVTNITIAGAGTLSASPPNPTATISNIGAGMTVVTYTNTLQPKKLGYLEICKVSDAPGNFSFTVSPGGIGPLSVPDHTCTPPIQVPAGYVTVQETAPGFTETGCVPYQVGVLIPCSVTSGNSVVLPIAAGGVQNETMVFIINGKGKLETRERGGPADNDVIQNLMRPAK